jgi:hypothetical protein
MEDVGGSPYVATPLLVDCRFYKTYLIIWVPDDRDTVKDKKKTEDNVVAKSKKLKIRPTPRPVLYPRESELVPGLLGFLPFRVF